MIRYGSLPSDAVASILTRATRMSVRLVLVILLASAWPPSTRASAQMIRGVVVDSTSGEPVEGAVVALSSPAGDSIETTWTDSAGRFRLDAPVTGFYSVRASHIGYEAGARDSVAVASEARTMIVLRLAPRPLPMDTLSVEAEALVPHLDRAGFYHRMRVRIGHFITGDQIRHRGATRTADLLRGLPGVRVIDGRDGSASVVMRGGATMMIGGSCRTAIVIDGVVTRDAAGGGLDGLPHPDEIEGIEVYTGATVLPAGVGGGTIAPCGAVLIWTRR